MMLAVVAVLVVALLALFARIAAPRKSEVRLKAVAILTALFVFAFGARTLLDYPPIHSALGTLSAICIALVIARLVFVVGFDVAIAWGRAEPLPRIVRDLSQGAILFVAALVGLHSVGVEPSHLLTTSAVISVVAGLALQETLGNLLAGLTLQADRPFQVGDW